jgi:hypothetical protein
MTTTPNTARCLGSGSYEDGKWHWREGCDDCQRRYGWAGGWIDPPPIIAFECEYRIGPDEIVAQREHAPVPEPLSPAAQAVLDAVVSQPSFATRKRIAAALCAAADQVVSRIPDDCRYDVFNRQLDIRAKLLAIATELKNHQ